MKTNLLSKCRYRLRKAWSDQRGSSALFAALAMVALIGMSAFVLDMGMHYTEASKLQTALDSAVLAASKELPAKNTGANEWNLACYRAVSYASKNNYPINNEDIKPIYEDEDPSKPIIGIQVSKSINVDYTFARVLGFYSKTIERSASAGLAPAGAIRGAVPLSITSASLEMAIESGMVTGITIKCSSDADEIGFDFDQISGWFGTLRFEGNGASTYSSLLALGYSGTLKIGQILEIEKGNMSGPTLNGFTTRYNSCLFNCTADNFHSECPRLVYIPVVEVLSNRTVEVVGFAPFFLEECGGNGNNSYIKATCVSGVVVHGAEGGENGGDFGLYVSKLFS